MGLPKQAHHPKSKTEPDRHSFSQNRVDCFFAEPKPHSFFWKGPIQVKHPRIATWSTVRASRNDCGRRIVGFFPLSQRAVSSLPKPGLSRRQGNPALAPATAPNPFLLRFRNRSFPRGGVPNFPLRTSHPLHPAGCDASPLFGIRPLRRDGARANRLFTHQPEPHGGSIRYNLPGFRVLLMWATHQSQKKQRLRGLLVGKACGRQSFRKPQRMLWEPLQHGLRKLQVGDGFPVRKFQGLFWRIVQSGFVLPNPVGPPVRNRGNPR